MLKILFPVIAICLFFSNLSYADSPLTSTTFYEVYSDYEIVKKARESGVMNEEFANYLHSKDNPIDVKAALINALGWDIDGKYNAEIYCSIVFYKNVKEINKMNLSGDELFCIGYMQVLDDYFNPEKGTPFLNKAVKKLKSSYTVAIINALAEAQKAMDDDWCEVWKLIKNVNSNENIEKDMREEATEIILDYMRGYEEYCK